MKQYDVVVVGGGLIGLATAREVLKRQPDLRLALLEKEPEIARHQSGHNSGVIHTGIYYTPGSMKAKACVAGHREMLAFCDERGIQYDLCGKVIVALDESELPRLQNLYERGTANGVQGLEMIGQERLRELEPYAAGIKAIHSPNTGIIDYGQVTCAYADDIRENGGEIITNCKVTGLVEHGNTTTLVTTIGDIDAEFVITCGGLHSDRIANMSGGESDGVQIVPFRGDYYVLRPEKRHMCKSLIYPVPDPEFPFLGVHFTKTMRGEVWAGPNAVLAFAREGYGRWQVNPRDLGAALTFGGFWKMARQYWRTGMAEMYRDYSKGAYLTELRRYMPALRGDDLLPGPSGVRAQALSPDGKLVDDFLIKHGERVAHVRNAPSPGATSSMVIARMIVDTVEQKLAV
ncbi:MAG: L-2-hydroxyglutarate oxidase [Burkholderiales bacterium]|nr:L-2-hydroxyglutarate oxidase [Anaerolineae bacterium]